ncbi:hypothetical protein L596_013037 [Steinernema carpocapsae]|uniref:Uncharacterized protein n=1 Tax=Steinernema carpocapsae TaxID=34508 RepID=A0A4U5NZN0_STECR|nr:hypothetical protein L596_013037 [Steinernema carpocapsae]
MCVICVSIASGLNDIFWISFQVICFQERVAGRLKSEKCTFAEIEPKHEWLKKNGRPETKKTASKRWTKWPLRFTSARPTITRELFRN